MAKKKPAKQQSASQQPAKKKPFSVYDYIPAWALALLAALLAYVALSLAIDSGSIVQYAIGLYFIYSAIHHGLTAYHLRKQHVNKRKTTKARRAR